MRYEHLGALDITTQLNSPYGLSQNLKMRSYGIRNSQTNKVLYSTYLRKLSPYPLMEFFCKLGLCLVVQDIIHCRSFISIRFHSQS
jgi:hypothetical protein